MLLSFSRVRASKRQIAIVVAENPSVAIFSSVETMRERERETEGLFFLNNMSLLHQSPPQTKRIILREVGRGGCGGSLGGQERILLILFAAN